MEIRELIKQTMTRGCEKQYEKALKKRKITYRDWLAAREGRQPDSSTRFIDCARHKDDMVLLQLNEGYLMPDAEKIFKECFAEHPEVLLAYGDEDVAESAGAEPVDPWFKPDWSPDTFLSEQYLGGVIALRKSWLDMLSIKEKVLQMTADRGEMTGEQAEGVLLQLIMAARGFEKGCSTIGHIPEIVFRGKKRDVEWNTSPAFPEQDAVSAKAESELMVSVVIPSKDHPDILQQGLNALYRTAGKFCYEVLIVDNGSSQENRRRITELLKEAPVPVTYIYEPMDFNFSAMCNMGAEKAVGKYLLLLNDDVEMRCEGWMEHMVEKASHKYAGAVGIKLYYPDSVRIQHAGIVNLPMGPVHKLQFLEDTQDYYYGYQKVDRNVLAVTGACLMVHRDKYWEAGGMSSELPVAFNDVDLCYRLWELGYHNVICNQIYGWHHESLSRGDDELPQKLQRLLGEKAKLYARHTELKDGKDPYYSVHLNRDGLDTRIRPGYVTAGNHIQTSAPVKKLISPDEYRRDNCLLYRVERCEEECIQGYGVVLGDNNACYNRELIFWKLEEAQWEPMGQITCFSVPLEGQYRPELLENMPDQSHVALCGFWWKPEPGSLPKGKYRLGMIACRLIGGTRLINWSNHILNIEN